MSARCYESEPARRVANEMRRDTNQLRQNDTFAVLFDTFHDRRNGYIFYANAIGGFADSQVTDEGPPNVDWNTVWSVRTAEFDGGWTIEMAIPFKSLRYGPGREQTWGVNLRRVVRWKNEWSYLAHVPRALTTFRGILKVSSAGTLTGLEAPGRQPHRRAEAVRAQRRSPPTAPCVPPSERDFEGRVGGDFKYGLTQNLTADLTVNTDFAQVEVDEQQVNLTRFNLFFPEKRDFFLEGAGTFAFAGRASAGLAAGSGDTPYLFFSRRIGLDAGGEVPLLGGGRAHRQERPDHGRRAQRPDRRDDARDVESANFTVLRVKRDILSRSAVGGMFTHRTATPGPAGQQRRLRRRRQLRLLPEPARRRLPRRHPVGGRRRRTTSATAASSTTTPIATACRLERLEVQPGFLPEIGLPAPHRLPPQLRPAALQSAAAPHPARVRKLTTQASLNYTTNIGDRLDTREQVGQLQTEFTNSDVAGVTYTDSFDRLVRPFAIARGSSSHRAPTTSAPGRLSYTGGQQRRYSGPARLRPGHVLQRQPPLDRAQHRPRSR